jgi:N-acetylglucosamine-6-phosphate deacetylase
MKTVVSGILNDQRQQILIEEGIITKIGQLSAADLEGATRIETDGFLYPGFIDIHIHGGGGADTMDATEEAFRAIAQTHAAHGTTGLYLTTITESVDRTNRVMRALKPGFQSEGAQVLGFHLEGPFISPRKPGAHPIQHILEPSVTLLDEWIRLSKGQVKVMTIAPELPGAEALIRYARERGIMVSMGHSAATYAEAQKGKEWGAQSITHLFNAMNSMHHREPGLLGLGLSDDQIYVELIADFLHVHPAVVKSMIQSTGVDRLLLITDAIRATCMPDGVYELGGQMVEVREGKASLHDGTLAGSTLTLDQAVRNLIKKGYLKKGQISHVTARNQARLLGLKKGVLQPGFDGDVIALDDHLTVTHTIVAGRLVYRK